MSKGYNNEPFPSKKFQEVIAEYLEHEEKKIDGIEEETTSSEEELVEYANNNT
jgi:hypothetical protein